MRITIGIKIFSIAVALLLLMAAVAWINLRMTRTVDAQLVVIDKNYFPAVTSLAQAHVYKLEQSSASRRLVAALLDGETPEPVYVADLRRKVAAAGRASSDQLAAARRNINEQIADALNFDDDVALARLDTHLERLQEERARYEAILARWIAAAEAGRKAEANQIRPELDAWRDDWDKRMEQARDDMRAIAGNAILGTRAYQERIVQIGLGLLVIAGLLGITIAAIVTDGMVRPVRRLLAGTNAVENGELDTVVPVTSRDEIGRLTESFNNMVGELRVKAQIRETFGKYVDPRIVTGLIERPELIDPKGARREMTILFCDMQGFTSFSEGMTPAGLVNVLNRYLAVISEPVRRNNGIIDKYIGDAVMAYWGPPFTGTDEHARLACFAALEQLDAVTAFEAELPELTGVRGGLLRPVIRVGVAAGEVVIGNIGSEQTRSYTVIGDTVNLASRLEGACKVYGTRTLIGEQARRLAGDAVEAREIDTVLVVGKSEPERVFELLGRIGEVAADRLEMRDIFETGLAAYRGQDWDKAEASFRRCLAIVADDPASKLFLARIADFRARPPDEDWFESGRSMQNNQTIERHPKMNDLGANIITMRPFLPAKDFEISCRYYEMLGFSVTSLGDKIAHVQFDSEHGQFAFLLQDFYVKEFAENLMMHLLVRDLDAWWAHIAALELEKHFEVPPPRPPALQSWGMHVAYIWDPAGVLWHIALESHPTE